VYYAQHNHLKSLDDVDGFGAAVSSKPGKLGELIHADFSHNALAYVPVSVTAEQASSCKLVELNNFIVIPFYL